MPKTQESKLRIEDFKIFIGKDQDGQDQKLVNQTDGRAKLER